METGAVSDGWLAKRAAAGDETAFERLIAPYGRMLRNIAATFDAPDTTVDDLAQIVAVKLWTELQRGAYNPRRASFEHYLSTVAYQALRDDKQRRRAQGRWAVESPLSLDMVRDGDPADPGEDPWIAPSWHLGADPANVVLERERLRLAWQALSETNQRAINRWLTADGGDSPNRPGGLTDCEIDAAASARARGRRALDGQSLSRVQITPEVEAEIRAMRERGRSLNAIASALDAMGIRPPKGGDHWGHTTVVKVLARAPALAA